MIVTNEEHCFLVLDQLRELKTVKAALLLEPVGHNTSPALSLATHHALDQSQIEGYDPILVIAPADQTIQNQEAFVKSLQNCVAVVAEDQDKKTIAILGVVPTTPETGYGYIQRNSDKGKK